MANTYSQIFSIVDRYSAPVLKIEDRLRHMGAVGAEANKLMAPHEKLFTQLGKDIGAVTEKLKNFGAPLMEMGHRISDVFAPLAAVGAAGSLAGVVEMVHSYAEATEQLEIAARVAGSTVAQFQALSYAAKQTGVDTGQLQTSMGRLNRNLAAAATGQGKPILALMNHLHISLRGAHGQILSAAQALPKLADAFAHTKDPAMQALMATTLFGKSGLALLPLLDKGSSGLKDLTSEFNKYGYTLSNQDVQAGDKFNESWKNMQTAMEGFTNQVSAKLAPVLTPVIQQFTDLIASNRAWIATDMAGAVQDLANSFKHFDLSKIIQQVKDYTEPLQKAVDAMGGFKTVAIGVGAALALNLAAPLIMMTAQVGMFAARSAIAAGSVALNFARLIPSIGGVRDAFVAMGLAADANPFGVIVIGAALAGTAAYELYEHWNTVSKDLSAAWQYIDAEFKKVFGPIEKTIQSLERDFERLQKAMGLGGGGGGGSYVQQGGRNIYRPGKVPPPSEDDEHDAPTGHYVKQGNRQIFVPGSPSPSSAAPQQHVVTINIPNLPSGSTVKTQSTPGPGKVVTNVGYSRMRGAT
jgi:hypothetical protein